MGLLTSLLLLFLLWNFNFAISSLKGLERTWGRKILVNSTGLERENLSDFFPKGLVGTLVVNSSLIMLQKDLLLLPAFNTSQSPLKIEVTNSKAICPNPSKHGISPFLLFLIWQLAIKSDILDSYYWYQCLKHHVFQR